MTTPAHCVFCRRDLPHEKHVTPLEYSRIYGKAETYVNHVRVLDKPSVYRMVSGATAKEGVLAS